MTPPAAVSRERARASGSASFILPLRIIRSISESRAFGFDGRCPKIALSAVSALRGLSDWRWIGTPQAGDLAGARSAKNTGSSYRGASPVLLPVSLFCLNDFPIYQQGFEIKTRYHRDGHVDRPARALSAMMIV